MKIQRDGSVIHWTEWTDEQIITGLCRIKMWAAIYSEHFYALSALSVWILN